MGAIEKTKFLSPVSTTPVLQNRTQKRLNVATPPYLDIWSKSSKINSPEKPLIVSKDAIHASQNFPSKTLNATHHTKVVAFSSLFSDFKRKRGSYRRSVEKISSFIDKSTADYASFICKAIKGDATSACDDFEHVPFREATGDDHIVCFAKAIGYEKGQTAVVRPKNAQELLEAFIVHFREHQCAEDPESSQHAFTLTPEDPTIIEAIRSQESPKEWIRENVIKPGLAVSNQLLTASQKTSFINALKTQVVKKEWRAVFNEGLKRLDPKINSIYEFSNRMIELIRSIIPAADSASRSSLESDVSSVLIESVLPASAKKLLSSTCVRIADTNWIDQGVKRIYFGCFLDPVTKALALGIINEDGTNLRPLDQWAKHIPWELYGIKTMPLLTNHKVELFS